MLRCDSKDVQLETPGRTSVRHIQPATGWQRCRPVQQLNLTKRFTVNSISTIAVL